jgi:hypothetical protein
MRCDEVIRELAAPTDDRDATALAEHLAGCLSCSGWARQAARLDQLWDATRPSEPSPEAWDSVWANIAQSLPSPTAKGESPGATFRPSRNGTAPKILTHPAPTHAANPPRIWRIGAVALVGLAQAAAILVAIGLAWRGPSSGPMPRNPELVQDNTPAIPHSPSAIRVSSPVRVEADIEEGRLLVILADGPAAQVMDKTPPEMAYGVDAMYVMFNVVESIANPVVASR